MRLGMICRYDNSGLGTLSWEFSRHLKPAKVLLVSNGVYQTFPERYTAFETRKMTDPDASKWILEDIDVLVSFETFYNQEIVKEARRKGVKTALVTMFEMTPDRLPLYPDLFLCPSKLDLDVFRSRFSGAPSEYLPIPVATDRIVGSVRKQARRLIHTASHGGMNGRKGTALIFEAMKHVKSDAVVTVFSWSQFVSSNPKVEVRQVNFKNYWQAWREGDAVIYPQDYNGICLPVQEAFASGLAVVSTAIYPFTEFLPERFLFEPDGYYKTRASPRLIEVDAAKIDPVRMAAKIDEVWTSPIEEESSRGVRWGRENSWERWLPEYHKILQSLCK